MAVRSCKEAGQRGVGRLGKMSRWELFSPGCLCTCLPDLLGEAWLQGPGCPPWGLEEESRAVQGRVEPLGKNRLCPRDPGVMSWERPCEVLGPFAMGRDVCTGRAGVPTGQWCQVPSSHESILMPGGQRPGLELTENQHFLGRTSLRLHREDGQYVQCSSA